MDADRVTIEATMEVEQSAPPANPARGLYLLDFDNDKITPGLNDRITRASPKMLGRQFIDGIAFRPTWKDFEASGMAPIDTLCRKLQVLNKKLSLYVDCEEYPKNLDGAQFKYTARVKVSKEVSPTGYVDVPTCAPWDRHCLDEHGDFVRALAAYPCWDSAQNKFVPFAQHPCLAVIRWNVIGRTHTARDLYANLLTIPNGTGQWNRQLYIDACIECLTTVQDAFPGIPLHTGFFTLEDEVKLPSFDVAMLNAFAKVFDGVNRDKIGLFEELLTGQKPRVDGVNWKNLKRGITRGFFTTFQAIDCWTDPFTGDLDRRAGYDGVNPAAALAHGHDNFGTQYFEMYNPDLHHLGWDTLIWIPWHNTIWQQ